MTDISELRELVTEDLESRLNDLDDQVFRLRMQQMASQDETPNKMRQLRRDRARVKTLLKERQLAAEG